MLASGLNTSRPTTITRGMACISEHKPISAMTDAQIMEKLRQVVCDDNAKLLYSKITSGKGESVDLFPCPCD